MQSVERAGFITHKSKQILLLDFTNCTPQEVTSLAEQAERIITSQPENSVLVLADFAGAQFSRDTATRIKEVTTHDRPFVKRVAWVHTENLPKVALRCYKDFFSTRVPNVHNTRGGAGVYSAVAERVGVS